MEILAPAQYEEYETFVKNHPNGNFTQSSRWPKVKDNWKSEIVVSRDDAGNIRGGMLLLMRNPIPMLPYNLIYAPRGPVCDYNDRETLADLLEGAKEVAKRHKGFLIKMDPPVLAEDSQTIQNFVQLGCDFTPDAPPSQTTQVRTVYVIPNLQSKTKEELLASFKQKTRYNIRVAMKHGVVCKRMGIEGVEDFYNLHVVTAKRDHFIIRSLDYYRRMLETFPEEMCLFLCYYQDRPVSAAFCSNFSGRVTYLFGASDNANRNVMPSYLMQWEMMQWAMDTGADIYDFYGTPLPQDVDSSMAGIYRFKSGFQGEHVIYAGEFNIVTNKAINALFNLAMKFRHAMIVAKKKTNRVQ